MNQKIQLIGRVGNSPEFHNDQHGTPVCSFSLGVSRGRNQQPLWFWVTTWEYLAVACYAGLAKRSLVYVEGHLTGGEDGHPRMWKVGDVAVSASFDLTASMVAWGDIPIGVSVETFQSTVNQMKVEANL